jgi:small acid-soluble spore protein L (minor)
VEILKKWEVSVLTKKGNASRGVKAPSVNPQGYGQDAEMTEDPKSTLENNAKKSNTKR